MRILFNTMNLGKGGAERVINILSNEFVKKFDVKIVTNLNMPIEYEFDKNIEIVSIEKKHRTSFLGKMLSRISILKFFRLKNEVLNFVPDVIISFLPEPSFRILLLKKISKKIRNIPVIVSVRNDPNIEYNNPIYKLIMKKLYPYANQLVLQTNDSKNYFINNINFQGIVIQNPVSDSFLIDKYDGIREKRIVAVGRLNIQKNYKNMIDAFEIVSKKHNDFLFEIYGDGELRNELQNYIDDKKLHDTILLMGKVDNVKNVIYKATAFVMSSDYEGMPNSLLEAACLGVPCVSTNCPCGGPKDILDNGKNGVLVNVNDSNDLAKGIIKLIEDTNYSKKISTNANNNQNSYSIRIIIGKWMDCLNEFIND